MNFSIFLSFLVIQSELQIWTSKFSTLLNSEESITGVEFFNWNVNKNCSDLTNQLLSNLESNKTVTFGYKNHYLNFVIYFMDNSNIVSFRVNLILFDNSNCNF